MANPHVPLAPGPRLVQAPPPGRHRWKLFAVIFAIAAFLLAGALAAELTGHAREVLAQRAHRRALAEAGQPAYELPLITDGIDLAGLYRLAGELREQGAA